MVIITQGLFISKQHIVHFTCMHFICKSYLINLEKIKIRCMNGRKTGIRRKIILRGASEGLSRKQRQLAILNEAKHIYEKHRKCPLYLPKNVGTDT